MRWIVQPVNHGPLEAKEKGTDHVVDGLKRKFNENWAWFGALSAKDKARAAGNGTFPCTRWAFPYDFKNNAKSDLVSGLTVGVMVSTAIP